MDFLKEKLHPIFERKKNPVQFLTFQTNPLLLLLDYECLNCGAGWGRLDAVGVVVWRI